MDKKLEQFLSNPKMKDLYVKAVKENDQNAIAVLNEEFNNYLFEISFLAYVNKILLYSHKDFYKYYKKIDTKEKLFLNHHSDLESIYNIVDDSIDIIEQISINSPSTYFREILTDFNIVKEIEKLTKNQKDVLYKCIVEGKSDTEVAEESGKTKQTINKTKKSALHKLRQALRKEDS